MSSINRREFLKDIAVGTVALGGSCILEGERLNAGEQPRSSRPNILFIMCDQLNANILSCYGGPVSTPNIDWIAQKGVRFTQASCPTPVCSPSRMSICTGLYPHQHGVVTNTGHQNGITRNDITTDGILQEAGYATHFLGKWHRGGKPSDMPYYSHDYDLWNDYYREYKHIFEETRKGDPWQCQQWVKLSLPVEVDPKLRKVVEQNNLDELWKDKKYRQYATRMGRLKMPVEKHWDYCVTRQTCDCLKSVAKDDNPFMITCSLNIPHDPYALPSPYYEMYQPEDIKLPDNFDILEEQFKDDWARRVVADIRGPNGEEVGVREFLRIYYGSVKLLDDLVGQLLETLKQTGQLDNTVIAFTADHGDMVGGHGMAWKSTTSMYDEVLNIPFLLSYPKLFKPDVSEISVDHVDWMPTLLELAGQAQSVPSNHAGRSLVPYLTGDKDPGKAYPYKLSERVKTHPEGLRKITPETDAIFVLRGNGWKYRFQHGKPEYLYHLQNDPGEIHNLANNADFAQIKADLRSELVDYLKRTDWKGRNVD